HGLRLRWGGLACLVVSEMVVGGLIGQNPSEFGFPHRSTDPFGAAITGWYGPLLPPGTDAAAYARPDPILRALPNGRLDAGRYVGFAPGPLSRRGYLSALQPADWGLMVNQRGMLFDAPDAQGYNPFQLARYWRYVRAVDATRIDYNAAVLTRLSRSALDLLAVRSIVASEVSPPESGDRAVATSGRWALFDRGEHPTIAQAFTSWAPARSADQALSRV